jgi:hypothetical protein
LLCRLRLWLLLFLLLLLLLLLLFLFCEVMSDSTTGRRANDAMMASHVPCYAPYNGTLDATFRLGTVRAAQEHKTHQGCGKRLHLHCHTLRHTFTPSLRPQIGLYTPQEHRSSSKVAEFFTSRSRAVPAAPAAVTLGLAWLAV